MPVDAVRDAALDAILRVFEKGAFLDASLDKTLRCKAEQNIPLGHKIALKNAAVRMNLFFPLL